MHPVRLRLIGGLLVLAVVGLACQSAATPVSNPAAASPQSLATPLPQPVGQIAFASDRDGNYEIYTIDADGEHLQRLTDRAAHDFYPAWSPDGQKIVFLETDYIPVGPDATLATLRFIYIMNADGSDLHLLTDRTSRSFGAPRWSPDGSKIALPCSINSTDNGTDTGGGQICVIGIDGTDFRTLLPEGLTGFNFAWSPDGTQIAFPGHAWGSSSDAGLYIIDSDSSNLRRLHGGELSISTSLAWSPDGAQLAVASDAPGGGSLMILTADGSEVRQIDLAGRHPSSLSWSVDGQRIAFISWSDTMQPDITIDILDRDGANLRQAAMSDRVSGAGSWSPEGSRVAFTSQRPATSGNAWANDSDLEVMNLDGSNHHVVTSDHPEWGQGMLLSAPSWRPIPSASDAR